MKKMTMMLLLLAAMVTNGWAVTRSAEEAAGLATKFLMERNSAIMRVMANPQLDLVYTHRMMDAEPAMYVFARGNESGYVIVSADDKARTILAYSDEGTFDEANMPPAMRMMLQNYADQLAWAQGKSMPEDELDPSRALAVPTTLVEKHDIGGLQLARRTIDAGPRFASREKTGMQRAQAASAVEPLLENIMWDQDTPYNNMCPDDPDPMYEGATKCLTGCVATGIAQVMRFHKHPTQGTGSHSYDWKYDGKTQATLSANFNTTYDWNNMLDKYINYSNGTKNYNTTQANAVAKLMYHVGVAVEMTYGGYRVGGSGTNTKNAVAQLPVYFGYDKQMYANMPDYQGQTAFEDNIRAELNAGRPVVMSGRTVNNEGHCFVCDGYNADGLFHINWGWSGTSNAYFVMSALDPDQQGAGGAASGEGFRLDVAGITGIRPNEGGTPWPQVGLGALEPSATTVQLGQNFSINLGRVMNVGLSTINGTLYVGLFQNGSRKDCIGVMNIQGLDPGYYYTNDIYTEGYWETSLADGTYDVIPFVYSDGAMYACEVQGGVTLTCTISGNTATFVSGQDNDVPSDEVLNSYKTAADQLVVAVQFLGEVCNDIVFTGSYNGWSSDVAKCAKFQPVTGYDNWYVVAVTDNSTDIQGKPVQLDNEGNFKWDYQTGDVNSWTVVRGSVFISPGYAGESNLTNYDKSSPVVLISSGWKNSGSPCDVITKDYTINLYAPTCATANFQPAIIGDFNNWAYNVPMTHVGDNLYTVTVTANSNQYFKFREVNDTDWSNQILINIDGVWYYPDNLLFGDAPTREVNYSDGKWQLCDEEVDYNIYNLVAGTDTVSKIYFQFESEAPLFYVSVEDNGQVVVNGTIDFKNVSVKDMEEGTYTIWVYPLDENENALGEAASVTVTLENWSVTNLETWTNQDTIFLNVESKAPYFYVEVDIAGTYEDIAAGTVSNKSLYVYGVPDGDYDVWVVALDETQTRTIGLWQKNTVTVKNTFVTAVPTLQENKAPIYYDLLGRPMAEPRQGAVLIRTEGTKAVKVMK